MVINSKNIHFKEKGFTLIEVVVFISVCGIFFSILSGVTIGYLRMYNTYKNKNILDDEIDIVYKLFDEIVYSSNQYNEKINKISSNSGSISKDSYLVNNNIVLFEYSNEEIKCYYNNNYITSLQEISLINTNLDNRTLYVNIESKENKSYQKLYYVYYWK